MIIYYKNCGKELIEVSNNSLLYKRLDHRVPSSCNKAELGIVEMSESDLNSYDDKNYLATLITNEGKYEHDDYSLKFEIVKNKLLIYIT